MTLPSMSEMTSQSLIEGIPENGTCPRKWAKARASLVKEAATREAFLAAADEIEKLLAQEDLAAVRAWVTATRVVAYTETEEDI